MLLHYIVLSIDHMIILDGYNFSHGNCKSDDGLGANVVVSMTACVEK